MKNLLFWLKWDKSSKNIFSFYVILILCATVYFLHGYIFGLDRVIGWDVQESLKPFMLPLPEFDVGNFKILPKIESYVVLQYLQGSLLKVFPLNSYLFLFFFMMAINLLLAILPSIKKFWFYIGMGIFILFAISLRLENLYLFGEPDKIGLIIFLSIYLSVSYIFHEIKKETGLWVRYVTFTLISIIFAVFIVLFSESPNPFVFLTNYGIIVPIAITVIFIIIISHEIIFGFLYIITHHNTKKSAYSLEHFLILSSLYLLYIILSYLWYAKIIRFDFWYVNPFLLFFVSMIIGLYGFKRRESIYEEIFPFKSIGGLLYLSLALVSLSTMSYVFNSANDPLVETFEDIIFYGYIGYGAMFFAYIITNFFAMLIQNYQVSKIAYQPTYFPFYLFRIVGLITLIVLFLRANMIAMSQARAGYYNGLGDVYYLNRELRIAEELYNMGAAYEFQNHRSNYSLASLAKIQGDKTAETFFLEYSLLKKPSEYSIINLSNLYQKNGQFWQGLFNLLERLPDFPTSSAINNNAGYFYSKTDITDSAYYYFDKAYQLNEWKAMAGSNIFGLLAENGIVLNSDSLKTLYSKADGYSGYGNFFALTNLEDSNDNSQDLLGEPQAGLTQPQFVYHYNLGYKKMMERDTAFLSKLDKAIDHSISTLQEYRLKYLKSAFLFYIGRTADAFRLMDDITYESYSNKAYYRMMGIWSLQAGNPRLSIEYFDKGSPNDNSEEAFYYLVACLEAGELDKANILINRMDSMSPGELSVEFSNLKVLIDLEKPVPLNLSDIEKYQVARYRKNLFDSDNDYVDFINSIENIIIRTLIWIELAEKEYNFGDIEICKQYLNTAIESDHDISELDQRVELLKIRLLYRIGDYAGLEDGLKKYTNMFGEEITGFEHYRARLLYSNGDTLQAYLIFKDLSRKNPFDEEAIIDAANFFYDKEPGSLEAYNLYLEALKINPYSVPLLKAFTEHCIRIKLIDYALDVLPELEGLWPRKYHEKYVENIEEKIRDIERENQKWFN